MKKYEKIPWHDDETWWNMWVLLSIWVLMCVFFKHIVGLKDIRLSFFFE